MKGVAANVTRGLPVGAKMKTIDNSGAKLVQIIGVHNYKGVKGRMPSAGVGDLVSVRVINGKPDIRNKVALAIIVRQAKEYRRPDGTRIKFQDNAVVILKDDKGNPKGTILKGPMAKEAAERWPIVAKLAPIVI
jgi:large subunit ribosomal protein L14